MTEKEREELIEKMANGMFASKQYNGCFTLMDMARAALAVAEPVIREQCARIARQKLQPHDIGGDLIVVGHTAETIVAAIREGENGN